MTSEKGYDPVGLANSGLKKKVLPRLLFACVLVAVVS